METPPTFGAQFLAEVRRLVGGVPMDYAVLQRVKQMTKEEVITYLRRNTGPTYAQIQQLKLEDDPRELARFFFGARQKQDSAVASLSLNTLFLGI